MRYGYPYGIEIMITLSAFAWFTFAIIHGDLVGIASSSALLVLTLELIYLKDNEKDVRR